MGEYSWLYTVDCTGVHSSLYTVDCTRVLEQPGMNSFSYVLVQGWKFSSTLKTNASSFSILCECTETNRFAVIQCRWLFNCTGVHSSLYTVDCTHVQLNSHLHWITVNWFVSFHSTKMEEKKKKWKRRLQAFCDLRNRKKNRKLKLIKTELRRDGFTLETN